MIKTQLKRMAVEVATTLTTTTTTTTQVIMTMMVMLSMFMLLPWTQVSQLTLRLCAPCHLPWGRPFLCWYAVSHTCAHGCTPECASTRASTQFCEGSLASNKALTFAPGRKRQRSSGVTLARESELGSMGEWIV